MDELHMCHYCGQPLEDLNQLHDITHCAKYAIETSIPTLQNRVEELESRLKQALHFEDDTADGYDWQVLESAFKYDDLRTAVNEAVKEIEDSMQSADWEVASVYDGALLILKNHGLVEDK